MNNWILPHVKQDIDALKEEQLARKQEMEERSLLTDIRPNYVLIDAALWDTDIDMLLMSDTAEYRSLFRGSTGEELWSVAPYLVDISSDEELIKQIKEKDPIKRRVTWLFSSLDIDGLRKHLRHFLRMQKEDKSYIYFRFYDPFVVNTVFPYLTPEQAIDFFKNIDYIVTNDVRLNERHIYYLSQDSKLKVKTQPIDYVDNNG